MAETTDLQRLIVSLEANTKAYQKELAKANGIAEASTRRVARDFDRMNAHVAAGFSKLAIRAAAVFSIPVMVAFAKKAIEAADEIGEAAERAGVTAESFQELAYAAKLAGVSSESMEKALQQLSRRAGGAADDADEVSDALNKLGLATADIQGMKPDALFKLIADRIAAMKNPMQEATVAYALFGREGQKLLPTLRGGSVELARLGAEARKMGLILSDETLRAADKAANEFDRVGLAMRAAGINISIGMLPALEQLRKMLTDPAAQEGAKRLGAAIGEATMWLVNNKDTIILVASTLAGIFAGRMLGPAGAAAGGAAGFAAGLEILEKIKGRTSETTSEIDKLIRKQAELDAQMKTGDYGEAELNRLLEQYNKIGQEIEKLKSGAAATGGAIGGVAAQIADAMKNAGYQTHQIAAALAAVQRESSFNPSNVNPTSGAFGLFQWLSPDRVALLRRFAAEAKTSIHDVQVQIATFLHELENGEKKAGDMLRAAGDPEAASRAMDAFERYEGSTNRLNAEVQKRIQITKELYAILQKGAPIEDAARPATDRTQVTVAAPPFVDDRLVQLMADIAIKTRIAKGEFSALGDEFVEAAMKLPETRKQLLAIGGDLEKHPALVRNAVAAYKEWQLAESQLESFKNASRELGSGLSEAFKGMIFEAKKFDEVISNLFKRLAGFAIDRAFMELFAPKHGIGILGALFGLGGSAAGRASGGPVEAGRPYMVGERGRELFMPQQRGVIVPNTAQTAASGDRTINVNMEINLRGANGDETIARVSRQAAVTAATEAFRQAQKAMPGRQMKLHMLGT